MTFNRGHTCELIGEFGLPGVGTSLCVKISSVHARPTHNCPDAMSNKIVKVCVLMFCVFFGA